MRRIELSGPDASPGVACEVRYWRNAMAPETAHTLWRASQDTDFCAAKARELVARLEAGGWTCSSSEQPASAAPMRAAGADREVTPRAALQRAVVPAQVERAPEPAPAKTTQSAKPPTASPPTPKPPSAAVARADPSDEPRVALTLSSNAALLDQVVEQTLHSVQELYGGQFQAELAAFGDLDGDGLEDAAVLITYQAERDEYVQYLVAYLFNGQTFQSVATRNVGGRFLDALRADLQGIADGKILVELEALDGGAACCATRRTAFALDNGQLVEVGDPGAASLDGTGEAETPTPG